MRLRMEELALAAGVSKATVDRVLNNRAGVQEHTRAHVLAVAASLSGERSGKEPRKVVLDFVLPGDGNAFIADLAFQILRQVEKRGDIDLCIHRVDGIDSEAIAMRLGRLRPDCQGVGVIGLDSPAVREAVRRLIASNIKVLTLVSDISHVGRVSYVGIDNRAAGRLAGYIIGRFLPRKSGQLALLTGTLAYRGHEEREMGFRHVIREQFAHLQIVAEREVHESADNAHREARDLLAQYPNLLAIYCVGAGHEGITRALIETGRDQDVVFVAHDLTDNTRASLLRGIIDAVIDQNSIVEGREAVDRLVRAVKGEDNIANAAVRIQSVFRENLPTDV